jgi:GNAT superfamily N-acetyltransferase
VIKPIDFSNHDLAKSLYNLQKASYKVEAELVQFNEIPPLKESFAQLLQCGETFIGYFEDDQLAGAISYTVDANVLTICRMTVHPIYFRKGIAQKLLQYLEETQLMIPIFKVSTGKDNLPAKNLYFKNGYQFIEDIEVAPNFYISQFEKRKVV